MSSSVTGELPEYPGLGLPLRHSPTYVYPTGVQEQVDSSTVLTVRELAMMVIMEKLTDKADWHKKVFDEEVSEQFRKIR